jgi:hypothetical protein
MVLALCTRFFYSIASSVVRIEQFTNSLKPKNISIMKKITFVFLQIIFIGSIGIAQSANDVLRFSAVQTSSTARSLGAGNAMSVLGGDFSGISINPAGLAGFRSSDLTVSFGYSSHNSDAKINLPNMLNNEQAANKFTFNNVGLVLASQPYSEGSNWKTTNFAVGLNKLANFNRDIYYQGDLPGSIVTRFKKLANNGQIDAFGNDLAIETGALYDPKVVNGKTEYFSDFDLPQNANATLSRSQSIRTSGYVNELVFAYAGNYKEKVSIGATIGIPFAKYEVNNSYNEVNKDKRSNFPFNSLNFQDNYILDGTGVNLKIGAIVRPIPMLRLGLAVHTPTVYNFSDNSVAIMKYNYGSSTGDKEFTATSPNRNIQYTLATPWKFIGSAGVVFGKNGFLTAEIEHVNYAGGRLRFEQTDTISAVEQQELKQFENEINDDVKSTLQSAINVRLGGEFAYDVFRLRAGVNILGATQQFNNTPQQVYTLGAGVRGQSVFFDLAYSYLKQSFGYQPYIAGLANPQIPNQDAVSVTTQRHNFVATLGFKF